MAIALHSIGLSFFFRMPSNYLVLLRPSPNWGWQQKLTPELAVKAKHAYI